MRRGWKHLLCLLLTAAMVVGMADIEGLGVMEVSGAEIISIATAEELARIGVDSAYPLDGDYILTADLDLSGYPDWNPIGGGVAEHGTVDAGQVFSGTFDGQGHVITGLTIDRTVSETASVGLFGIIASGDTGDSAVVSNLVIQNPSITVKLAAQVAVGALAGEVNGNTVIDNIAVTGGYVKATAGSGQGDLVGVGGLIGEIRTNESGYANRNSDITIQNIFTSASVYGENPAFADINYAGGVIGRIRNGDCKILNNIFNMGGTAFYEASGFGIAGGDSTAAAVTNVYFLNGSNTGTAYTGVSYQNLRENALTLGEQWVSEAGSFPYLTIITASEAFSGEAYLVPEKLSFQEAYAAPGASVTVIGGTAGSTYTFTIRHTISGITETVTNTTGVFQLEDSDVESMVTVSAAGQETASIYCTKLPVMYLETDTAYYDVTKEYNDVNIRLVGNGENTNADLWYNSIDGDDKTAEIKLRGNSTAYRPKRPFKLKLGTKKDLLGLGENDGKSYKSKHWVLLANDIDHTLLRNKLLYDFSGDIGTEFYFHSTNVAVIYNGEYKGVYQLCEHRRVDEGRIDITNWEDVAETAAEAIAEAEYQNAGFKKASKMTDALLEEVMLVDWSWLDTKQVSYNGKTYAFADYDGALADWPKDADTGAYTTDGGFLMEMDFYSISDGILARCTTGYKQPLYFSAPEPGADAETEAEQTAIVNSFKGTSLYQYANTYTQTFEYALHSDDFFYRDSDKHYAADAWQDWTGWHANYNTVSYQDAVNTGKHYSQLFDMDSLINNFIFCEYAMNWDSMKNSFFYYKDVNELAKIGPQWDFDWAWGNINMHNINTWYPTSWHTTEDDFTCEQYYQTVQWNRMLIRDPWFVMKAYEKYKEIRPTYIEEMIKTGGLLDSYYAQLKEAGAANDAVWDYTYTTEYKGATSVGFEESYANMKNFIKTRVAWLDQQFASLDKLMTSLGYYKTSSDIKVASVSKGSKETTIKATTTNSAVKTIVFQVNGTTQIEAAVVNGSAVAKVPNSVLEASATAMNMVQVLAKNSTGNYIYNASASQTGNYRVVKSNYQTFYNVNAGKISVSKTKLTLKQGTTSTITASVLPGNALNRNVTWKSSNTTVATVVNGKITAKAPGTAKITATTNDGTALSASCTVTVKAAAPALKLKTATNCVELSWSKAVGGVKYEIYRSTKANSGYQKITTTTGLSYKDKKAKKGKLYYYKVKAITANSGYSSELSKAVKAKVPTKCSSFKKKAVSSNKITLKWKKNKSVSGYEIYRSTKKNSGYKKVKTISRQKTTTAAVSKLKANKTYYFKIRGYYKTGGKKIYGSYSKPIKIKTTK